MESRDERFTDYPPRDAAPAAGFGSTKPPRGAGGEDDDAESPMSSPQSPAKSPAVQLEPGSAGAGAGALSPGADADAASSPDVGPRRPSTSSSSRGGGGQEKEKRKRSRVTPDQLVHLERFFSMDRSPTAARRREISELLGMQERQTQIWFQNRRAKAKLLNGKGKGRTDATPPATPPELRPGYDADLHSLIHENEPVTIIPCTDLTIGTWRRIATQVSKHDLVAYVCESRNCLIWFIHSSGYGFKMEIPFDIIVETEFVNAAPGSGLASFFLSQPPLFYLEDVAPSPPTTTTAGGPPLRAWKRCADWTEGMQATKILRHDLVGSAVQLAHVLRNFQVTSSSDIRLRSPAYMRSDLPSGLAVDPGVPRGLAGEPPQQQHGYRSTPFGGGGGSGAVDVRRDGLGLIDLRKRSSFAGLPLPLSAPPDTTEYDASPHAQFHALSNHPSPAPPPAAAVAYPPYALSSASSSSGYSTTSLYPTEVAVQRPHVGYGEQQQQQQQAFAQGYAVHTPPASAPPAHGHFGLAPTPPPLAPQPYTRHAMSLGLGAPYGNGFETHEHHGH